MAEITTYADDLDGSTPAEPRYFSFANKQYAIDLSEENNEKLEAIFAELGDKLTPFLDKARAMGSVSSSAPRSKSKRAGFDPNEVRAWARENGYEVADRGRIKREILDAYQDRKNRK